MKFFALSSAVLAIACAALGDVLPAAAVAFQFGLVLAAVRSARPIVGLKHIERLP